MPTLIDGMGEKDTGLEDNGRTSLEPRYTSRFF
jgi:hypothetical protein